MPHTSQQIDEHVRHEAVQRAIAQVSPGLHRPGLDPAPVPEPALPRLPGGPLMTAATTKLEELLERFERVNGRPLVAACPPGCTCRGRPGAEELDRRQGEELGREPAVAGR